MTATLLRAVAQSVPSHFRLSRQAKHPHDAPCLDLVDWCPRSTGFGTAWIFCRRCKSNLVISTAANFGVLSGRVTFCVVWTDTFGAEVWSSRVSVTTVYEPSSGPK